MVEASLIDVDAFWERSYEELYGEPYEPISGGFWAYGPDSEQPPCGEPPPGYGDIAENAFFCPSADLIAWDNVNLIPGLYEEFGGFTLGIVFAHEFGHAIQFRADTKGPTILTELQADCFAGAWTADVEAGNSDFFELTLDDLDKAVAGFLELRDGVGTAAEDPAAHGTGFDRIGSFVEGFEQGLERCAAYPELLAVRRAGRRRGAVHTTRRTSSAAATCRSTSSVRCCSPTWRTSGRSSSPRPARRGRPSPTWSGSIPTSTRWSAPGRRSRGDVLVNASFYCIDSDTIYFDDVNLIPALNEIGDYAVATEIARQYAYAAQVRMGVTENTLGTNLNADCLAGLYAFSGFSGNRGEQQQLVLSPGDLDEAVIAFLLNSDSSEDVEAGNVSVGTAFQRFDAYRSGFLEGTAACDALLEEG